MFLQQYALHQFFRDVDDKRCYH